MSDDVRHLTRAELEARLDDIRAAPKEVGAVRMIVRRPVVGARERLGMGELSPAEGLVGDRWRHRGSSPADEGLVAAGGRRPPHRLRAQFCDDLVVPGYDQDAWVTAQRYQEAPWSELVSLWPGFNLQIARVIEAVPDDTRKRERHPHNLHEIASRGVPKSEPATIGFFMHDYVDHLEHHLLQILAPILSPTGTLWSPPHSVTFICVVAGGGHA